MIKRLTCILALWSPAALFAAEPPEVVDGWAGDNPYDEGGVIAARWRNAKEDPPNRFWRVQVTRLDTGEVNWPKPGGLVTDYKAGDNLLKDVEGPFWCWPPVPDEKKDTHWVTMDLALHFPPKALDGKLKAARDAIEAAKGDKAKVQALEAHLRDLEKQKDAELERIRSGRYRVQLMYQDEGMGQLLPVGPAFEITARPDGWDARKLNNLVFTVLLCGVILYFIARARKVTLFLRRIPGIDAVEEAIGRATEMGKPIYFLTGRLPITSVSTMAAATILGEVAKKVAAYDTRLKVPHVDPITMSVCQEITREAYLESGRPDAFQEDANFYVTDDQFSYVAAVDGMFMREKPAACFYMGYYYAEALILAETGAAAGAIQIAGTDAEHQLPFFVTACDYTLLGEELYAASAYLSKEPVKTGTLRGQDAGKLVLMLFLFLGSAGVTIASLAGHPHAASRILDLFKAF